MIINLKIYIKHKKGGGGCLISGGCTLKGSVPLDRFIETFREVKQETDLQVVVHTGLASKKTLKNLSKAGVDVVSLDVIGSDKVIREIYQLNVSTLKYEETMRHMQSLGLPFVPHILVGLYHGEMTGEEKAVPRGTTAGRSSLPDRERSSRALAAGRLVHHSRGGLLLRPPGPDKDHE